MRIVNVSSSTGINKIKNIPIFSPYLPPLKSHTSEVSAVILIPEYSHQPNRKPPTY